MTKYFSFAVLAIFAILFLGFTASIVSAQVYNSKEISNNGMDQEKRAAEIKQRFDAASQYLTEIKPVDVNAKRDENGELPSALPTAAKLNSLGPGDNYTFATQCNDSEPQMGNSVNCWVTHAKNNVTTSGYMDCMELTPGRNSGRYDGTVLPRYFSPSGSQDGLILANAVFQRFELFDIKYSRDSNKGEYVYSCVLWNSTGSEPVQQIIFAVNVVHGGPFKAIYHINKGELAKQYWRLTGNFMEGAPHYYLCGVRQEGEILNGPDPQYAVYPKPGGKTLDLPCRIQNLQERRQGASVWAPGLRVALMIQREIREPAYVPPAN